MLRHSASASDSDASSKIRRVGVIGAGQMGTGIAFVSAVNAQCDVVLTDTQPAQLQNAVKMIGKLLAKDVGKGKMTQAESDKATRLIRISSSLRDLADCDIVIEAASENMDLKRKIFGELSGVVKNEHAILASNTSSISITQIAAATTRPQQVIGMHFMNPVPVMKLVEIICGLQTSEETFRVTNSLAQRMGKVTTRSADVPGFIANRLLLPFINEAIYALSEGVATKEDIDTTMKLGTNHPMGPLQLADFIGLDTCLAIMQVLHRGLGDDKYRPAPLLQKYVHAGWLGVKTKRGFYVYNDK